MTQGSSQNNTMESQHLKWDARILKQDLPDDSLCSGSNRLKILITFQYCELCITHLNGVQGVTSAHVDSSRANNPTKNFIVCNEKKQENWLA